MRRMMGNILFDRETFGPLMKRCTLGHCKGTCCHDGASMGDEEAGVIEKLVVDYKEFFEEVGLVLPESVLTPEDWHRKRTPPKTKTVFYPYHEQVSDYPQHFPDTACLFLLEDRRCAIQVLSEREGHHPWYWKPFTCWLHPITFHEEKGRRLLCVHKYENDPQRREGYDGFVSQTHCGRHECDGKPAWEVLAPELEFLGQILGRDFLNK